MRGMLNNLTLGERVAWYRRRRGLSQEVLAGLIDRTVDWLSKIENNRIELDRLSVIRTLAAALDVSLGDLLAEPSLLEWSSESGRRTIPAVREALMDYRNLVYFADGDTSHQPAPLEELERDVADLWSAYQHSRFGYVAHRAPLVLSEAQLAARAFTGDDRQRALSSLALTYHATATMLTKVGEVDLAWIASDRGLVNAQQSGDVVVVGSLLRSVTHSLLSSGRYTEAIAFTGQAAEQLRGAMSSRTPQELSVYGTLFLAGSMAAARAEDRQSTRDFLAEAAAAARELGRDGNYLWTAFGPTNVDIHRVATAMELGDLQIALELGPSVVTTPLPIERRVRHKLEVARALSTANRRDRAVDMLLDAESMAPEQVRYHYLSRQLVMTWVRSTRTKPSQELAGLARRLRVT